MSRISLYGIKPAMLAIVLLFALLFAVPGLQAQSGTPSSGSQSSPQTQQPSPQTQPPSEAEEIPDAPSTVQPPTPKLPAPTGIGAGSAPNQQPADSQSNSSSSQANPGKNPPPMPPVETVPPGTFPQNIPSTAMPRNQINPAENLYKISVTTNFVQLPVMVEDSSGRRVDGLSYKDFIVLENGKPQKLTYFSSDPFQLAVAVIIDTGMHDVTLQKVNETYSSLVGAFSPYDEFALYTFSSVVRQVVGFTRHPDTLTAALDGIKLVRGQDNGPPVLNGPMAMGPTVNGAPVGGPTIAPVNTPEREEHVLNDAILRAAIDLSKQDRTMRKVILVISDGRELGSSASYKEVLRVLETHGIQVKAVVVGMGSLPVYNEVEKLHHIFKQGYSDILPKYVSATGGGQPLKELTRNSIEDAYAEIMSQARNQYTLGYSPKAMAGSSSAYRSIEVQVDKKGLSIYTKSGYYPVPTVH